MINQQNDDLRESIANALIDDYCEYLYDLTLKQLQIIRDSGYFTIREALSENKLHHNKRGIR